MTHPTRRQFNVAAAAALATAGLPFQVGAQQEPIRIGLLTIDSGPFSTYASLAETGARAAVDILNAEGGALGRRFELVVQAHSGTPAAAIQAATRLAQQGKVSMITGQTLGSHSLALIPRLEQLNVLLIDSYATTADMLTRVCSPNYFRVSVPDPVTTRMMQDYVRSSGAKTWNLISADYASGHSFAKAFGELVTGLGGAMQQTHFSPLGTTDFGSYITQMSRGADGLLVQVFMSDGQSFAKQARQFGLFDRYKLILGNGFATDFQLEAHGDNVLGVVNALSWTPELPGARNATYVKEFVLRNKRRPFYTDSDLMAVMEVFRAGVVKAGGTEPARVRKALEGLKVDTIFGNVEMRAADHHLIRPHGMAQVVRARNGGLTFEQKVMKPGPEIYPAAAPECKAQA